MGGVCKACLSMCAANAAGEFSFLGALILEAVVAELATLHGLSTASDVYLAGTRCESVASSTLHFKLRSNLAVVIKSIRYRLSVENKTF